MKILILLGILILASSTYAVSSLDATITRYDPVPFEAGKIGDIWIRIDNNSDIDYKNVSIILEPEYPLKILDKEFKNSLSISGSSYILYHQRFIVDENAPEGDARFKITVKDNVNTLVKTLRIPIINEKQKTDLSAIIDKVSPSAVPGKTSEIVVEVINRDHGTSYFTVIEASTEIGVVKKPIQRIGNLDSDDFDIVTFEVDVSNDVLPGEHPLNLNFSYKDEDGIEYEKDQTLLIDVVKKREAEEGSGTNYVFILILITFVGVSYAVIKYRRKKKK